MRCPKCNYLKNPVLLIAVKLRKETPLDAVGNVKIVIHALQLLKESRNYRF